MEKMVLSFYEQVSFSSKSSVLDLGCGSGAFLYVLQKLCQADYYGIDYSESLIKSAGSMIPGCNLKVAEADQLIFKNIDFDLIYSYSVFQYFPSPQYAEKVFKIWSDRLKPGGLLALMDINDGKFEDKYHSTRAKSYTQSSSYLKDYEKLPHLFLNKTKLKDTMLDCGFEFVNHFYIDNKNKNQMRFNILGRKKLLL